MEFKILSSPEMLEQGYEILCELRSKLTMSEFRALYDQAKARDEYRLLGAIDEGKLIGVMGYRVLYDFVHGKHLYVDILL